MDPIIKTSHIPLPEKNFNPQTSQFQKQQEIIKSSKKEVSLFSRALQLVNKHPVITECTIACLIGGVIGWFGTGLIVKSIQRHGITVFGSNESSNDTHVMGMKVTSELFEKIGPFLGQIGPHLPQIVNKFLSQNPCNTTNGTLYENKFVFNGTDNKTYSFDLEC